MMNRSAIRWWIFLGMVLLLPLSAWGQGPSFDELDRNRDGVLSRAELERGALDIFQRYDKDGDGYLTKEEFAAIPGTRSRFEDLDANKDGRLDIEELKRVGERRFQACDSNGDGVLDTREIQVCGEQREERDRVGLFPPPTAPERQQKDRVMDGDLEQSPRYRPAISPVLSVYF